MTTTGTENVLYSFTGDPNGAQPTAPLVAVNGTLYGTTAFGGEYGQSSGLGPSGDGTVFAIAP
jgi:hypothetical protein